MPPDPTPAPDAAPTTPPATCASDAVRFGPSPVLMVGRLLVHKLVWIGALWGIFALSLSFRAFLWRLDFPPWRSLLISFWGFTQAHPAIWPSLILLAALQVAVCFFTSSYTLSSDYIYVRTGPFSSRSSMADFFRVRSDPIPLATVLDANTERDMIGFFTGTGTLWIKNAEERGRGTEITWVRHVDRVQEVILSRAGVKNSRMIGTMRS